jgi:hypothetical protein
MGTRKSLAEVVARSLSVSASVLMIGGNVIVTTNSAEASVPSNDQIGLDHQIAKQYLDKYLSNTESRTPKELGASKDVKAAFLNKARQKDITRLAYAGKGY